MDYKELKEVLERLNKTVAMAQKANSVSLDETLTSVNETLIQVGSLLEVVQVAILIIAVAFSILLIGITATCYYAKYKKYNQLQPIPQTEGPTGTQVQAQTSYVKSDYHPTDI